MGLVDGEVLVIGAGLAGSLAALALREQGLEVLVVAPPQAAIASYSGYGGVVGWPALPGPLGEVMVQAPGCWSALEQRHGCLGWQPCELSLYWQESETDAAWPLAESLLSQVPGARRQDRRLILPFGRVDGARLAQALPQVLARSGVRRLERRVVRLETLAPQGWRLQLAGGEPLDASRVLLAAGPGSLGLWPPLAERQPPALAMSWSGALVLEAGVCPAESLPAGAAEGIVMPLLGQRQGLEARCPELQQQDWIVDVGLAPRGSGWWLGQISVVAPQGAWQKPPDPTWMEAQLRRRLGAVWPQLAQLPGRLVQVPVAFPAAAGPLFGAIAGAPGLWGLAGFQGAFALLPVLAPDLASSIAGTS